MVYRAFHEHGVTAYRFSNVHGEMVCCAYKEHGMTALASRACNVHGMTVYDTRTVQGVMV